MSIIIRGNTVFLSFSFVDEDGEAVSVASADLQLTYPGRNCYETEAIDLEQSGANWIAEWDSIKSRAGWVQYHAHAIASVGDDEFAVDGRFRIKGNSAGFDHDALPGRTSSTDYSGEL